MPALTLAPIAPTAVHAAPLSLVYRPLASSVGPVTQLSTQRFDAEPYPWNHDAHSPTPTVLSNHEQPTITVTPSVGPNENTWPSSQVTLLEREASDVPKSDVNTLTPRSFLRKRPWDTTSKVMVGVAVGISIVTGSIVTYICCKPPRKRPGPRGRTQDSRVGEGAAMSGDPREEPGDEEGDIGLNDLMPHDTTAASQNPVRPSWPMDWRSWDDRRANPRSSDGRSIRYPPSVHRPRYPDL